MALAATVSYVSVALGRAISFSVKMVLSSCRVQQNPFCCSWPCGGGILAGNQFMKDMILHIDDSVDFIAFETKLLERRLEEYPDKSRREIAELLFCDEIVNELDSAGVLDQGTGKAPTLQKGFERK